MNRTIIQLEPLNIAEISDLVADDSCGAISMFVGTTRDNFGGKRVLSLEYEAYEPMVLKEFSVICDQLRLRWSDLYNIAIYHRIGLVPVRETSIVIAISSPHRKSALEAVGFAIDEVKRKVPIWKKEIYDRDDSAWMENKECSWINENRNKITKNSVFDTVTNIHEIKCAPSKDLVQISAKDDEITRRIQCFTNKKRCEINNNNIYDFMQMPYLNEQQQNEKGQRNPEEFVSCARTYSLIIKQENSKGHLKVRRVNNYSGPQTRPNYLLELDKLMCVEKKKRNYAISPQIASKESISKQLENRINNIQEYLEGPQTSSLAIMGRIRKLENRILYLESLSPEYKHFMITDAVLENNCVTNGVKEIFHCKDKVRKRKKYSIEDLNGLIK